MPPTPDPGGSRGRLDETAASFFDAPPFLEALAEAQRPGAPARIVEVRVAGRAYRVVEAGGHLLTEGPFVDLHAPLGPATGGERFLGHLSRAVLEVVPADTVRRRPPPPGTHAAPFVDWRAFPRYRDFTAFVRSHRRNAFSDARRRTRRLEEAFGPVAFYRHHEAEALLELAFAWKRDQYRRSGSPDYLAPKRNADLFRILWKRGLLEVGVLRAGTRPVAVHLGATWEGRFHYWVPAYDSALAFFAPGRLLLLRLLEASYAAGDRSFELLSGDEAYKWTYANAVRIVGPVGEETFGSRLLAPVRQGLAAAVRSSPPARSLARRTRRYLVEHGVL